MTFAQMQTLVGDYTDDVNFSYFTLSTVKLRLNLALRELQKRLISANKDWYSICVKTNTVAAQKAYALPSDFLEVIRLERIGLGATTGYPYFKIDAITPNERDNFVDTTGAPCAYYMQKNNLMLVPTPDTVYEIHLEYAYYVADMVNDSDIADAPPQFHEYIPVLAARDCFIRDARPLDSLQVKLKEYETLLKQIAVQRQADSPRMVVTANFGDY